MAFVKTEKATVRMTERTLRQLISEIDRVKTMAMDPDNEFSFTKDPMPDADMDMEIRLHEQTRRGKIVLKDQQIHNSASFEIDLEINPSTDEKEHTKYKARYLNGRSNRTSG